MQIYIYGFKTAMKIILEISLKIVLKHEVSQCSKIFSRLLKV